MNKVIHLECKSTKGIKLTDIRVGTFFRCDALTDVLERGIPNSDVKTKLLLRTFDSVVSVDNPVNTWDNLSQLMALGYAPVEVTIKEERYI